MFSKWPRLSSKNILFGAKNKLKVLSKKGTLFERCKSVSIFESLRNELIHNGTWEINPKVYFEFRKGGVIQKYIYLPDIKNSSIMTAKNRKRFFSQANKINLILPEICFDFWKRLYKTIKSICKILTIP